MKNNDSDIILPCRIGDSILSIPAIICLEQLNKKFNNDSKVKVSALPFLYRLLAPLKAFECQSMNFFSKVKSHFAPANNALFIETSSINLGYKAKNTYGLTNPCKKFQKYTYEAKYLKFENIKEYFQDKLFSFLREEYGLSYYSISIFGFCLDVGYTEDQIIETFKFSPADISSENYSGYYNKDSDCKYAVICMEAGYGKKDNEMRIPDKKNYDYYEIAKRLYEDYNVKSVFIGKNSKQKLPDSEYFIDLRDKIDLYQLACVMKNSIGYIGNDTGPLHIANLTKKKSVGLYFKENTLKESSPIFPDLNLRVFRPETTGEVYSTIQEFFNL